MATTALRPEALEAMLPYLREEFGNPQSIYPLGSRARQAVERAREQVAAFLGARPEEIIFTSSGAEANNLALRGLAQAAQKKGQHVIVSRMEHHSVLNSARVLERMGFAVTFLSPDRHGLISPQAVEAAMTPETVLVSIIHASPEVGTIEPIAEIAQVVKARGALMHTDCVASAGQLRLDVQALGVDALSISAHIFYGPKGAGALYLKRGTRIVPLIYGGIQESGRRAGTENVPAIVGMGVAAELAQAELAQRAQRLRALRDRLVQGLRERIEHLHYTGHPQHRLPGHASFCVEFIEGEAMLLMLAQKGIYAATGSACSSKALKASPVLLSMGIAAELAQGSVVFSLGDDNTEEDVEVLLREFPQVVARLREISPYAQGWGKREDEGPCIPRS
jgi:cysteine desulfurase